MLNEGVCRTNDIKWVCNMHLLGSNMARILQWIGGPEAVTYTVYDIPNAVECTLGKHSARHSSPHKEPEAIISK